MLLLTVLEFIPVAIFGLIIGSFLNVVIYRMHTGKSLNGRSHCLSCGASLAWYELVPVASYIVLQGRCRHCQAYIPFRYVAVEALTAFLFVLVWELFSYDLVLTALNFCFAAVLVVVLAYDLRHTIIPDEAALALAFLGSFIVFYGIVTGSLGVSELTLHVVSALAASVFFASLWYVSGGTWMGLGDAKLAFSLGFVLGPVGAFTALVLSFWIGAVLSLSVIALQKLLAEGKTRLPYFASPLKMKSEIPFAPFLIAGFVCAYFFHVDIFDIFYSVTL